MTASTAPTSTVSSSCTLISSSVPDAGEGISVSTLSVETSSSGSSALTDSPTCLSQRLTVPSVTLSPSSGRVTSVAPAPPAEPPLAAAPGSGADSVVSGSCALVCLFGGGRVLGWGRLFGGAASSAGAVSSGGAVSSAGSFRRWSLGGR